MNNRFICTSSIAIVCTLVLGCASEPGAPEIGDAVMLNGDVWTLIAPGVFERPADNGATLRLFVGKDGFTRLAAQHTAEREMLAARILETAAEDQSPMLIALQELDNLIASTQARADEFEAQEKKEQYPGLSPQAGGGTGPVDQIGIVDGSYCYTYAETGLDSPGIVDGYALADGPTNLYLNATVCASSDTTPYTCWALGYRLDPTIPISRYGYASFIYFANIWACASTPSWSVCSKYQHYN